VILKEDVRRSGRRSGQPFIVIRSGITETDEAQGVAQLGNLSKA